MPSALSYQDYQFRYQTSAGLWKWTTRVDVSGLTPAYSIRDVWSPWGLLRDSIPIPGAVIQEMSAAIAQLQTAFPPTFLVSPMTLTFDVDEGRGVSPVQTVGITNSGVFGSLLDAAITTDAAYVLASPANVGNLAAGGSGGFDVSVDSTSLLATGSPYSQAVTLQDATASNSPQTVGVTINVRSKAHIALSHTQLDFQVFAPISGPFPVIPSQQFLIQNNGLGDSILNFQIQKLTNCSPWLVSFTPITGTIPGNGGVQAVIVTVAPAVGTGYGVYKETLRISGYSDNSYQDIVVQLTVQ